MPADPTPDLDSFDRNNGSLILFEINLCMDLGLHDELAKKTEKYHLQLGALRRYWGRFELVCIPIDHAGTTLIDTATDIATALAKARPSIDNKGKYKTSRHKNKQDGPHPRQTSREYPPRQILLHSPNASSRHRQKNKRTNSH